MRVGASIAQGVVRFNSDGSIDNTFLAQNNFTGTVKTLALQPDGKIIVAGSGTFSYNNQSLQSTVIRLNTDGTLDDTFSARVIFTGSPLLLPVKIQTDGKILIVHPAIKIDGVSVAENIIRLNSDGSRDQTFDAPDFSDEIRCLDVQADGKVIAGGLFTTVGGTSKSRIVRLDADGSIDNTFDIGTGFSASVSDVKVINADRILVTGSFSKYKGATITNLVALKNDGSVDNTFTGNGKLYGGGTKIGVQTDGKIIIVGSFSLFDGNAIDHILRLLPDGTLDAFSTGTGSNTTLSDISINSADEILVLGNLQFTSFDGQPRHNMAILNSDGSLKPTIYTHIYGITNGTRKLEKQGTDKILVGHSGFYMNQEPSLGLARINLDGTTDVTFNNGGVNNDVFAILIDQNNNIVIGGLFSSYNNVAVGRMARLDADGNLDATFNTNMGTGFSGSVREIKELADGKLLIAGSFTSFNGTPANHVARLNTDGTLDNTFHAGTGFTSGTAQVSVEVLKVLPDGKILLGGNFGTYDGNERNGIVRLNADGTVDDTFDIGSMSNDLGRATLYDIEMLDDGRLLIGGSFNNINGVAINDIAMLNSDGTVDPDFESTSVSEVTCFAMQNDGKILAFAGTPGVIRLYPDGSPDPTFVAVPGKFVNSAVVFDKEIIVGATYFLKKIVLPDDPVAASGLEVHSTNHTTASLTWIDNASNEDGYRVERSTTDNLNYETIATLDADVTTYEDNTLQETTTYYYKVTSFNVGSDNNYSTEEMIITPPAAPTNAIVTSPSPSELVISWTDNSNNEAGFEIERSVNDNFNFIPLITLAPNAEVYTDVGLAAGTAYFYRVRAAKGTSYSDYTNQVFAILAVAAPSALTLNSTDGVTIDLNWKDNSANETEFIVKRSAGDELNYEVIANLPANTETYTDPGLVSGTTYYYAVFAANANGESSATKGNITLEVPIPAAPSGLTAQLNEGETSTTLTWTDNADNEDDFVIERSYDDGDFTEIGTTTGTTYEDTETSEAIKRSYRVRARNAAGSSAYSNTAEVSITVPEEPVTGIGEIIFGQSVTVYPNPAADPVVVEFSQPETGNVEIELSDVTGKAIITQAFEKSEMLFRQRINLIKPFGGMMLMKISVNKVTVVKKVIFR